MQQLNDSIGLTPLQERQENVISKVQCQYILEKLGGDICLDKNSSSSLFILQMYLPIGLVQLLYFLQRSKKQNIKCLYFHIKTNMINPLADEKTEE